MSETLTNVLVLGRRGLTRDVVRYALDDAGMTVLDLDNLADDPDIPVVAVLVNPTEGDWQTAIRLKARIVVVNDRDVTSGASADALARGADAVIERDLELPDFLEVVRIVADGGAVIFDRQAREVVDRLRHGPSVAPGTLALTRREMEILQSIDRGHVVKQTARLLDISEKTVQNLQSRLFRKLSARNRAQAVARAHELGLLSGNDHVPHD
jgi:DNA-binding NarL/FixJ family response regulator